LSPLACEPALRFQVVIPANQVNKSKSRAPSFRFNKADFSYPGGLTIAQLIPYYQKAVARLTTLFKQRQV